jgi:hypothetical protein
VSASTSTRDVEATTRDLGYPTATLASWEPDTKLQTNYHLPTDVPGHVRYDAVATAVTIAAALARDLAR